jgi:hypothetical protein
VISIARKNEEVQIIYEDEISIGNSQDSPVKNPKNSRRNRIHPAPVLGRNQRPDNDNNRSDDRILRQGNGDILHGNNRRKEETIMTDDKIKSFDILKKPVTSPAGIMNRIKSKMFAGRKYAINMELRNGKHRTFQITPKKDNFNFEGGTYIIDQSLAYDNLDCKTYMLDYHQDFSLPIRRTIPVSDVKRAIEETGMVEVESATNPIALKRILEADVGGGIARSTAIPEFIKQFKLMIGIAMVASVLMLLLFVIKSGMLSSVTGSLGI